jgi:hypothetical protein
MSCLLLSFRITLCTVPIQFKVTFLPNFNVVVSLSRQTRYNYQYFPLMVSTTFSCLFVKKTKNKASVCLYQITYSTNYENPFRSNPLQEACSVKLIFFCCVSNEIKNNWSFHMLSPLKKRSCFRQSKCFLL